MGRRALCIRWRVITKRRVPLRPKKEANARDRASHRGKRNDNRAVSLRRRKKRVNFAGGS